MVKELSFKNGKFTLVDDEDYEMLMNWRWNVHPTGYAYGRFSDKSVKKTEYMHRIVMKAPKGMEVDHINGNKLDNRKENLRVCTPGENMRNKSVHRDNPNQFKGVYKFPKGVKQFKAKICFQNKQYHLGSFHTPEEAAKAYNEAALKYHGEFAMLNEL